MQEQCLETQVKKVIQNDFVDSVYSANGDVRIGECVIKAKVANKDTNCVQQAIDCVAQQNNTESPQIEGDSFSKSNQNDEEMWSSNEHGEVPIEGANGQCTLDIGLFNCTQCSFSADNGNALKIHIKYKHNKERRHKCDTCEYTCYSTSSLKRHKQTHSLEKPFLCEVCQKRFHFSDYLKRHMVTHGDKERQYKCTECSYCTAYNCNLQYHIAREHSANKLFMCDVCDYKFITAEELKKHILSHSPLNFSERDEEDASKKPKRSPTDYRPYKCFDCPYRCATVKQLIQHTEKKCLPASKVEDSGEKKPEENKETQAVKTPKMLTCNECDYSTPNGAHLRRHMSAKHSTVKCFSCDICTYECYTADNLRKHKYKHKAKGPFKCSKCSYKCLREKLLHQHVEKKHGGSQHQVQ